MDEQLRTRIFEDLQGFVRGEILFDTVSRNVYSSDASLFEIKPEGIVLPADEEDLQNIVRYAFENQIPLIPRGAGTGLAGESLGKGIIVDMSANFRKVLEVGDDFIRVQPGVTLAAVNAELASLDRYLPIDTASASHCTIGGMVATDASGAKVMRYGYMHDYISHLRVILDNGDIADTSYEAVNLQPDNRGSHFHDIITAIAVLLEENQQIIRDGYPQTPFDRCGYRLTDILDKNTINMPRLLCGSEGTLAFFSEITVSTKKIPQGKSSVLLGFDSLDTALEAANVVLQTGPSACELMDRRLISLARGGPANSSVRRIPDTVEIILIVDYESENKSETEWSARRLPHLLSRKGHHASYQVVATWPHERDRIWRLREEAVPSLYNLQKGTFPVALIEDVGVPRQHLRRYIFAVQEILQEHELTASFLVHLGSGQVHTRPFVDLNNSLEISRLKSVSERVHQLAIDLGGTVSTQHGTGLARTSWVARQYGSLYPVFRQLKAIFDPSNIFNPGKITDPQPGSNLKWRSLCNEQSGQSLSLVWQTDNPISEIAKCNGCGTCRVESPSVRMCPIFHADHSERSTPRAKANMLRHLVVERDENALPISAVEVREVADLCVNCKMCASECPAKVNIPKLMLEAKCANVAEHGLYRRDWFFARIEAFMGLSSSLAIPVNLALSSRFCRWLLEKVFGVSRNRRMPNFAKRNFLRTAIRRGLTKSVKKATKKVAYFVDVFANYNDPSIAEATVAVLEHNGVDVYVPENQKGSGIAALAHGDLDAAREIAIHNIRILAAAIRDGYTIVCSEPSAAIMLCQDYLNITDDPEAELVASNTMELTHYLWELHRQGNLRMDFKSLPIRVGHHVPCHIKALRNGTYGPTLLSFVPQMEVETIDVSCSGMAGTYGMKSEFFQKSLLAGKAMIDAMQRPSILFGSTECSTCRMQIEHSSQRRTLHPVQFLALSYGLLPEMTNRLKAPIRELVLG